MKSLRLDLDAMQVTTFEVAPATAAMKRDDVTVYNTCFPECNWTA